MTDTKHPDGHELQAFFDNEMDKAAAKRMAVHIEQCEECKAGLAQLAKVRNVMANLPAPELTRTLWYRVDTARRRSDAPLGRVFKIALTAACAAGIVLGLQFGPVKFKQHVQIEEQHEVALESVWGGDSSSSLLSVYTTEGD